MKWLLVFGCIALIINASPSLADSDEDSSSDSSDSSSLSDSSSSSSSSKTSKTSTTKKTSTTTTCPVKILKVSALSSDTTYFSSSCSYAITKVNSTYNAAKVSLTVNKDLPTDTKVIVKIYQSSTLDGTYSSIGDTCSFGLTDTTSTYFNYLPRLLIKTIKSSKTLVKGTYTSEDFGFFKFYKLLSAAQLKHNYYKMVYNYECSGKTILSIDHRFQLNSS